MKSSHTIRCLCLLFWALCTSKTVSSEALSCTVTSIFNTPEIVALREYRATFTERSDPQCCSDPSTKNQCCEETVIQENGGGQVVCKCDPDIPCGLLTTVSTTPESTTNESTTPESTTQESTTPESTTPESTTPESTTPESTTPESTTPESTTPESTTPESTTPESTTPESTSPESTTPESTTPEPTTPESTTPKSTTSESTTPESTTPTSTPLELTTTEATTPESTIPESTTAKSTTPESTTPQSTTSESSTAVKTTPESTTLETTTAESTTPESTTLVTATPESTTTTLLTTSPETTKETKSFVSLCQPQARVLNSQPVDDCTYKGVARVEFYQDNDHNTNRTVCELVYVTALVSGQVTTTFMTDKICLDLVALGMTNGVKLDLRFADKRYPLTDTLFRLSLGDNGLGYMTLVEPYTDSILSGGPCQTPACGYNDNNMGLDVDFTDCRVVGYGEITLGVEAGLNEVPVRMSADPFRCRDPTTANSEVKGWLCFTSISGENVMCNSDTGSPVYCKSPTNGEFILMGVATADTGECDINPEVVVIPYPQ